MFIESFLKNDNSKTILRQVQSSLYEINFFAVLLDLVSLRGEPTASDRPIENSALRAAWRDGYGECVKDIFYFFERYEPVQRTEVPSDFGAAAALLKEGEIDSDEYADLTKRSRS